MYVHYWHYIQLLNILLLESITVEIFIKNKPISPFSFEVLSKGFKYSQIKFQILDQFSQTP